MFRRHMSGASYTYICRVTDGEGKSDDDGGAARSANRKKVVVCMLRTVALCPLARCSDLVLHILQSLLLLTFFTVNSPVKGVPHVCHSPVFVCRYSNKLFADETLIFVCVVCFFFYLFLFVSRLFTVFNVRRRYMI